MINSSTYHCPRHGHANEKISEGKIIDYEWVIVFFSPSSMTTRLGDTLMKLLEEYPLNARFFTYLSYRILGSP